MFCPNCGMENDADARYCKGCGRGLSGTGPINSNQDMASILINKKSEGLALILSLILPGLGQIYIDKVSTGILYLVAAIVLGVLTLMLIFVGLIYIALWIYSMYDAYTGAKEYNRYLLEHNGQPPKW